MLLLRELLERAMAEQTQTLPLHDCILAYPEHDRRETYLSFCSALIAAPAESAVALRYSRVLDRLALLWKMSDSECDELMKLARTNWQIASEFITKTIASRYPQ